MANAKKKLEDSRKVKIIVTKKYSEDKNKIFASTTIVKNGRSSLEIFRVPVDVAVEVPVEIARMLVSRKVMKGGGTSTSMQPEFSVVKASDEF